MPYGFVIDQNRCIGCHACTVACKSENDVPVGDFRTWVKYTEIGSFPAVKRHFSVLRCNQCTKAPCVTICPVTALHKRPDGIVDLDRDACIGCKACMQACPYDALYLNEDTGGAEKCHYCAHRIDEGREPACAVVCPEEAIIAGDYSDPESKIYQLRNRPDAVVRRPEQGTEPNVHYLGADPVSLDPGKAKEPDMYLWSERRYPAPDYGPDADVIPDATTVYDVNHKVHWGWKVSLYLVTKGIAAGAVMLAPLVSLWAGGTFAGDLLPELFGLLFLGVTLLLLVVDLKRPKQFLSILLRPNLRSWLVLGSYVLMVFGGLATASLIAGFLEAPGAQQILRYLGVPAAVMAAGYTAFLFAQCEGRDLWQDKRWMFPHLVSQALMLGAAALLPAVPEASMGWLLFLGSTGHITLALREITTRHETHNAHLAARLLPRIPAFGKSGIGAYPLGLALTVLAAIAAPLLGDLGHLNLATGLAIALCSCLGAFFYEQAFIRAGQLPPLS